MVCRYWAENALTKDGDQSSMLLDCQFSILKGVLTVNYQKRFYGLWNKNKMCMDGNDFDNMSA